MKVCKVDNCNKKHFGLGYCSRHYYLFKKYGEIPKRTRYDKNEIIIHGDYAEIKLYDKDGNEKDISFIDINDVEKVKKYKWGKSTDGYVWNNKVGKLHRFILNISDSNIIIDHINMNKMDNRKKNLRISNKSENACNCKKRVTNKSGYKNIVWEQDNNRYVVYINKYSTVKTKAFNCKKYGKDKALKEAIQWRNDTLKQLHGEFYNYGDIT